MDIRADATEKPPDHRPWWAGREGLGLWIGIGCNLLVFTYTVMVLLPNSQRMAPIGGDGFAYLLMLPTFFFVFPLPILPLIGAYWSWYDQELGTEAKTRSKGAWGILACILAPLFMLVFGLIFDNLMSG